MIRQNILRTQFVTRGVAHVIAYCAQVNYISRRHEITSGSLHCTTPVK